MLRFARRQYEHVLRRVGLTEGGLAYEDMPRLVGIVDDLREFMGECNRAHAYALANCPAVAAQYGCVQLVAPAGGMYIRHIKQEGCAATWWWGVYQTSASVINTLAGAQPTPVNIQLEPVVGAPACGSSVAVFSTIMWGPLATGLEEWEFQLPGLFIPAGKSFFIQNATANDANYFVLRWTEPGA